MNPIHMSRGYALYCSEVLLMIKAKTYIVVTRGFTLVEQLMVIGVIAVLMLFMIQFS